MTKGKMVVCVNGHATFVPRVQTSDGKIAIDGLKNAAPRS